MDPSNETTTGSPTTCRSHQILNKMFCVDCIVEICFKCLVELHSEHKVCYLGDPLHIAVKNNKQLGIKTNSNIFFVKKAMENVNSAKTKLENTCGHVAGEVRTAFSRYKDAMEEKEQGLLLEIEKIKQKKLGRFQNRLEELSKILSDLNESSKTLTQSLNFISASKIVAANKKTEDFLQKKIKESKLGPSSVLNIFFNSFDIGLLKTISLTNYVEMWDCVRKCDLNNAISFGGQGTGDGNFQHPCGVCCNDLGQIIVADSHNHRVQIFDSTGKFLYKFGRLGSSIGQFKFPEGITTNCEENLLVADTNNHRIQIFKMDGTFVSTFGKKGTKNGRFNFPSNLACNSMGQIVVTDKDNNRIQMFTSDGVYLNQFKYSNYVDLYGVCFAPSGDIIVTDYNSHRLSIVNSMLSEVRFIGEKGAGTKQFTSPFGVCIDSNGQIIVAEEKNNRIQVLDSEENYLWEVSKEDQVSEKQFTPKDVCLTPKGRLVVTDFQNSKIYILI